MTAIEQYASNILGQINCASQTIALRFCSSFVDFAKLFKCFFAYGYSRLVDDEFTVKLRFVDGSFFDYSKKHSVLFCLRLFTVTLR